MYQLFVGPLMPLFLRSQVWGSPGLPTLCWTSYSPIFEVPGFRWTSYSPIFEVPGFGSTWSANFSLDLFSPIFEVPGLGEYLVCQLFVGPFIPLFLRCQVWGVPGLPTFQWTPSNVSPSSQHQKTLTSPGTLRDLVMLYWLTTDAIILYISQ